MVGVGSTSPVRMKASRLAIRRAAATRKCPLPVAGSHTVTARSAASGSGCFGVIEHRVKRGVEDKFDQLGGGVVAAAALAVVAGYRLQGEGLPHRVAARD